MIERTFPEDKKMAIKVFKLESGLDPNTPSNCDITKDGYVYSWGLVQINLTQHIIDGVDCTKAFSGKNNQATVVDKYLYSKCVKLAQDPEKSLELARKIYDKRKWNAWGAYLSMK